MARSSAPRPAVPSPAERARTLTTRAGAAALVPGTGSGEETDRGEGLRIVPDLHHLPASGAATLQLPRTHPTVARVRAAGQLPVMLELTDTAPLPLRRPVRGLVWITGRLRVLPDRVARRAALRIAGTQPDERLLDVGHSASLLRLEPLSVVLSDAEGTAALAPADLAAAAPDPLQDGGDAWLTHLARAHPGLLAGLARHLPRALREDATTIAPLAVDRLGLRLRVESPRGDHDVRLGFERPVTCTATLGREIRALAGVCAGGTPGPGTHGPGTHPGVSGRVPRPGPATAG